LRRLRLMTPYLLDWLSMLVRWLHVVAGIAWIGASFYFVWLDNHLLAPFDPKNTDPGVGGELWAVHGGGFYRSQKYRVAPEVLPPTLHWFYWEAYTTWLSGFGLLCLLYFWRAEGYLIDAAVAPLSKPAAIAIALGFLAASWVIYNALCRSPLGRSDRALLAVIALLLGVEAWGLCHLFGGRGAFMLFGSALGTIMVANVRFVIIPGQREMVRAKQQGRVPDPIFGLRGKQRSVHNTYFTLPVVFVMISNHYAMTYGSANNWLVLIGMSVAGAAIRAWFVARHKPSARGAFAPLLPAAIGIAMLALVAIALAPIRWPSLPEPAASPAVDLAQVEAIVARRCLPCHAKTPTQPGFSAAPNGLAFDSIDVVRAHRPEVQMQLASRLMPLGNLTKMTEDERSTLLAWVER
jgi:uncharacterized membrane protein